MPTNLSIKNAPDDLVALLRQRAQRNHRSLQGELLSILEDAVRVPRRMTALELMAEAENLDFETSSGSSDARTLREGFSPYSPFVSQQREQSIQHAIELTRRGLPIGGQRFTRDEMHER
jgi:antitoxin FitA